MCHRDCVGSPADPAARGLDLKDPAYSELAGSYELVERRSDGSLLLRPVAERLSDVLRETADSTFVVR